MRYAIILFSVLSFAACTNNTETADNASEDVDVIVDAPEITVYGDSITEEGAMDPKDFLAEMEGKDSLNAKVKAVIKETCTKKGCWMILDMGNDKEMRVQFKDYGFFVPTEGVSGKTVVIDGYAYTDTIPVDHLKHLAEDAGKSPDEIAAITTPEIGTGFTATGVIIEQ